MENVQNAISGNAVVTEEATRNFKAGYRYVGKLKNHYALISVSYFKNELYKGENMKYVLKLLEENYVLIRRDADHVSWTVRNLHVDTLSKLEPATAKFYKIDYDVLS